MYRDARGGHNRKNINEDFFKTWSSEMAYVVGFLFADGAIEDVRKSSRTCYIQFSSKDRSILDKMRLVLSSGHNIYIRKPRIVNFNGQLIKGSTHYCLRIGNKKMYQDLINLGLTPRKSLTMELPYIPEKYFNFFLKGYFDGDGSVISYLMKNRDYLIIRVVFASGSFKFLTSLSKKLASILNSNPKNIHPSKGAFTLHYGKREGLKLLDFIYDDLEKAPYLNRKYKRFKYILASLTL